LYITKQRRLDNKQLPY